jgi:hypothetical protein
MMMAMGESKNVPNANQAFWVTNNKGYMPIKIIMKKCSDVDDLAELLRKLRIFGETLDIGRRNYNVLDHNGMHVHRNIKLINLVHPGTYRNPIYIEYSIR